MNEELKRYRRYIWVTLTLFLLSACALIAIPALSLLSAEAQRSITVLVAGVFWMGLAFGIAMTILTNAGMRRTRQAAYDTGKLKKQLLPGWLTFSKKVMHLVIYGIIAAGIAVSVSDFFLRWLPSNALFPVLSVTLIAFVIHSIIDGKNYKAYKIIKEGIQNDNRKSEDI